MSPESEKSSLLEIFLIYLRLGCLSFGGPVAHLGYFKEEFVNRRNWLNETRYAELLGICQFVPGPSSSQLGFAIGWYRGGLTGACIAWLGFTLPSALLMIGFAYGIYAYSDSLNSIVNGLLIAAVAVVANATMSLGKKLCPDLPRIGIAALSAAVIFLLPGSHTQIIAICAGALVGLFLYKNQKKESESSNPPGRQKGLTVASTALVLYSLLLISSIFLSAESTGGIYALHYRAGALVFGGGHVVLPLLNDSIVASGLVAEGTFLAGYSAAQTLPGPLFTLSAFLGTVGGGTTPAWVGGLGALIAIFLPGLLLLIGLLPYWNKIQNHTKAKACLTGANAAVVGLLLAALIYPVSTHAINGLRDAAIVVVAFVLLYWFKLPSWLVVLSCGLTGYIIY